MIDSTEEGDVRGERGGAQGAGIGKVKPTLLVGVVLAYGKYYGEIPEGGGNEFEKEGLIRFGTYNIQNCHNGGMESDLHGMDQANIDLGVMQETNLAVEFYTQLLTGYQVVELHAPRLHSGGMSLFFRESPYLAV